MSFANFDATRMPKKSTPPQSSSTSQPTHSSNITAASSTMPSVGPSKSSGGGGTVEINQISDAILQYSSNVDILAMLASGPTTPETTTQYNVQVDVTSQLHSRVQRHISSASSRLTSGDLPRTESARLRTTVVKLEKDFKKIEQRALKAREEFNRKRSASSGPMPGGSREDEGGIDLNNIQFQKVQTHDLVQSSIIQERDVEIRKINKEMATVNEIFKDLAGIVNEQQEEIDNIETLMENSNAHARAGLEQVRQANEYQSGCSVM
jgi:t-SNARE complex subunit (syntaxin)